MQLRVKLTTNLQVVSFWFPLAKDNPQILDAK